MGVVAVGPRSSRSAKLINANGLSASRQKFVLLDLGGDGILDPGESAAVRLVFAQQFHPRSLRVLAGAFA
jgi:hypothetical protein